MLLVLELDVLSPLTPASTSSVTSSRRTRDLLTPKTKYQRGHKRSHY